MGNLCSSNRYERDAVVRNLWKSLRAVPVLPINPNLAPLRVLIKKDDGYHDVGNVYSLCKPGDNKEWLKPLFKRRWLRLPGRRSTYLLPPEKIDNQRIDISDKDALLAELLGPLNVAHAAAWFKQSEKITVSYLDGEVREFNKEKWEEMMEHFTPDLENSMLGQATGWGGKRDLFIVQKVVFVSQIKITAHYGTDAGVDVSGVVSPTHGVNLEARIRKTNSSDIGEFVLSAAANHKLPVAFSGFRYTYDKFGIREKYAEETPCQPDGEIGESSDASQADVDSNEEEELDAQDDEHMSEFLIHNKWFATVLPMDSSLWIPPYLEEGDEEGDEDEAQTPVRAEVKDEEDDAAVNQNASGLEDID